MFSLRTLLLVVAIAALGAVALTTRNVWWASAVVGITILIISASILSAFLRVGSPRSTFLGFGVFALTYGVPAFSDLLVTSLMRAAPTHRLLIAVWRSFDIEVPPAATQMLRLENALNQILESPLSSIWQTLVDGPAQESYLAEVHSFFVVGHCLFTLAFGFLGAMLGTYLSRRPDSTPAAHVS